MDLALKMAGFQRIGDRHEALGREARVAARAALSLSGSEMRSLLGPSGACIFQSQPIWTFR